MRNLGICLLVAAAATSALAACGTAGSTPSPTQPRNAPAASQVCDDYSPTAAACGTAGSTPSPTQPRNAPAASQVCDDYSPTAYEWIRWDDLRYQELTPREFAGNHWATWGETDDERYWNIQQYTEAYTTASTLFESVRQLCGYPSLPPAILWPDWSRLSASTPTASPTASQICDDAHYDTTAHGWIRDIDLQYREQTSIEIVGGSYWTTWGETDEERDRHIREYAEAYTTASTLFESVRRLCGHPQLPPPDDWWEFATSDGEDWFSIF